MKKSILFFTLLILFTAFSCKKTLTSCIQVDQDTYSVGEVVTLTSCSTNELSYDWRIKGPENAPESLKGWSDKVITNTFTIPGSYTVTLNTYSKFSFQGDNETSTKVLTIN